MTLSASVESSSPAREMILSSGRSAVLRACMARSSVASLRNEVSVGVYAKTRRDVGAGTDEELEVLALRECPGARRWRSVITGDRGRTPAIMQSSWKTAVISTSKGGTFADEEEVEVRGRARIRATLMVSAQAMRSVESSCQWRVHLNRSGRGLSDCLSM